MMVMTSFNVDMLERISKRARQLLIISRKSAVQSREIFFAVRLEVSGELCKLAVANYLAAMEKWAKFVENRPEPSVDAEKVSHSKIAGLIMSVGSVHSFLKGKMSGFRVGVTAAVTMAAVLECLTSRVLVLAADLCLKSGLPRINPRLLMLALSKNEDLTRTLGGSVTIRDSGVVPIFDDDEEQNSGGSTS